MARDYGASTIRLHELCNRYIRQPLQSYREDGVDIVEFDPPLTTEEQATYDLLRQLAKSSIQWDLTPTEYDAIRPNLQALRDLRQLGRNAFLALTAAERDRRLYDAQTDTTIILLALLRSS